MLEKEILILKDPLYILSKKYYAGGERTFEGSINTDEMNVQLIMTFKGKNKDDISKNFLHLCDRYNLTLTIYDPGKEI